MVSGTDKRGPQLCRYREDEVGSRRGKKKRLSLRAPARTSSAPKIYTREAAPLFRVVMALFKLL